MVDTRVVDRVKAFDAQHSSEARPPVFEDGWVIFSDGACRDGNPLGALKEPPTDDWQRLKRIALYWKVSLRHATRKFNEMKDPLVRGAQAQVAARNAGEPPPVAEAERKLRLLRRVVKRAQRHLAKALAAVEDAKPPGVREQEARFAANRTANQDLLNRIGKIGI